ncbi:MAG TPA: YdeI/OmpD-associated family protein [Ilumatobacter sp.]|nr:YdeI/OmpD-associated family protein [Ilumatobacter sp.]
MEVARSYTTIVTTDARRRIMVPVPFDPDHVWGAKPVHRVHGTLNGMGVRAEIEPLDDGFGFVLGAAWRRDCGVSPGDRVEVVVAPEGPQRADLADDVRAALEADPEAGAFFDGLAQFYRRAYLRWIDATKRRPDERERRIAEMVGLLRRGEKERPQQPRPTG